MGIITLLMAEHKVIKDLDPHDIVELLSWSWTMHLGLLLDKPKIFLWLKLGLLLLAAKIISSQFNCQHLSKSGDFI